MPIYLDAITLAWATALLFYGAFTAKRVTLEGVVGGVAIAAYIIAQMGWTAAFLAGNTWGAHFNNYIWFGFNTLVMAYMTIRVYKVKQNENL